MSGMHRFKGPPPPSLVLYIVYPRFAVVLSTASVIRDRAMENIRGGWVDLEWDFHRIWSNLTTLLGCLTVNDLFRGVPEPVHPLYTSVCVINFGNR